MTTETHPCGLPVDQLHEGDCVENLSRLADGSIDLVFADPPYGRELGEKAFASALAGGWLAPGALLVLEEEAEAVVKPVTGLEMLETRIVAGSQILFYRRPR